MHISRDLDSSISSKPPSGDILKKSENQEQPGSEDSEIQKRSPGGQPGHHSRNVWLIYAAILKS
ncbi:hypothetical protein [Nostoc sp.]|uniref:hypothetical protein n=1 Tax=Nostoc sp. TaxID=1180 RepID=UPI002FF4C89E